MSWGSLRLTRTRAGAGLDGAELPVVARAPFASRPRPVSAPVVEDSGPRAELRARLRAEVEAAGFTYDCIGRPSGAGQKPLIGQAT